MADDNKPIHEKRFDAAVRVIHSLPSNGSFQPSNDMMLKFYSYYKQATQGPCDIPRPGFWDPVGKVKWDAWKSLGDMPKEEAMIAYVDEMKLILESMPITGEVEELLQVLGPFYEMVEDKTKITQVSDLSTGFGNMLKPPSRNVTKNIIRSMTENGTLEGSNRRAEHGNNNIKKVEEEEEDEEDEEGEEEEEEEEEEAEKEKEVSTLKLKVDGSAGKPDVPLTNGTVEHRVPPLTTHGSKSALNGEESLGEPESATKSPEATELNGHLSDHNEDVSSPHHLASDSDSEVYCDSVDQFGQEEGSEVLNSLSLEAQEGCQGSPPPCAEPGALGGACVEDDLRGTPEGVQHGGEDGKASRSSPQSDRLSTDRPDSSLSRRGRTSRSASRATGAQGPLVGSGGDGERWGSEGGARGNLNEQIVTALARLQEDMQSVLQRLHTLEALTASQARSLTLQPNYPSLPANKGNKKPSWWPFDVSPGTVAFAVVWPFVAQWLVRLYLQRRKRKIK
ncbi:hypothetical protein MATL_G00023650 [Megalops atlanticus]|uniref:Acyl-CoA-binding domain-containing protein 5 n=1 Tax=Megalops atlanticus TaxID=7932 RepID=A0A9D3QH52_MEGAT|nr:hypothetical protein MATL_G00023650 [Megalops atlanticus]